MLDGAAGRKSGRTRCGEPRGTESAGAVSDAGRLRSFLGLDRMLSYVVEMTTNHRYRDEMRSPNKPSNEIKRLELLRSLAILDTPHEQIFDRIVFTAAQLFRAPIALITLVDEERQWFKASVGVSFRETARAVAFCSYTILHEGPLIVENALDDTRFSDNPLVQDDPKIRFYAGAPLNAADGLLLGSLCVIDRVAQSPSIGQVATLRQLANKAVSLMCDHERVAEKQRKASSEHSRGI